MQPTYHDQEISQNLKFSNDYCHHHPLGKFQACGIHAHLASEGDTSVWIIMVHGLMSDNNKQTQLLLIVQVCFLMSLFCDEERLVLKAYKWPIPNTSLLVLHALWNLRQ